MDKQQAVRAIVEDALATRVRKKAPRRLGRACAVLGLTSGEAAEVAKTLELDHPEAVAEAFRLGFFGARDVGREA